MSGSARQPAAAGPQSAAERQRARRRRVRLGKVKIGIEIDENDLAEALERSGVLTAEATADRGKVEVAAARILSEWTAKILSQRDFGD